MFPGIVEGALSNGYSIVLDVQKFLIICTFFYRDARIGLV
jgi:hypothetical protein